MMTIRKKQIVLSILAIMMVITSLFSYGGSSTQSAKADLDPASKLICMFDDGKTIVNFYSTDQFQYMTRSKSAVTSSQDVQSSWLNKLLSMSGFDFKGTNESILGRPLNPGEIAEDAPENGNESAPKVSAFDRFGMAGLKWSSYQGEWKYYHVEACSNQDKVSPTNFGAFYEGRLEPKSTYNEVATSFDNRSVQFNKGVMSNLATAFTDTVANLMFSITKGIVTLTIVFVGLSFTDITTLLGMLESDGTGGGTATEVFVDLYNGIFSGFILLTFMFTALFIIYKGLIKRELRFALNTLIKTILIFIVAIIMASNPSYWIGIPNKITTYGQAIVLNTMNGTYKDEGGYSLCSTDVASIDEGVNINLSEPDSFASEFEKTNENMRSMIGCKMWEILLFKPWVKGQFGADFEELSADNVRNENEEWVGSPSVPLGDGQTIENWALFHLSTQTNAHANVGGGMPSLVNGVNSDWWRIADALSNYDEETVTEVDSEGIEKEFEMPVKNPPTEYWQSWVGNNRTERLAVGFISIMFGIVGSIAPLVFGVASAVYGLGITLLMMVSPIFLLFGTWGGKGDGIFMGWLAALVNTIIKKIVVGLLLVISLTLSMIIMDMIDDIGFIKSFILMLVVALVLVKNKDKFLNVIANVDLGGTFNPLTKANQLMQTQKSVAKEIGKIGIAGTAGSVAAAQSGQSIFRGARTGVARQLENRMQTSSLGRNILRETTLAKGGEKLGRQTCIMCHMPLGATKVEVAYQDDDGNYYCMDCAEEIGLEKLYEVIAGNTDTVEKGEDVEVLFNSEEAKPMNRSTEYRSIKSSNNSWLSHSSMRQAMEFKKVEDRYEWNDDKVKGKIVSNMMNLRGDAVVYRTLHVKLGSRMRPPTPPEPLVNYIDTALINLAWTEGRFEVVEETYKEAWKQWYTDNAKHIDGITEEQIERFKEELDEKMNSDEYNISETEAESLLKEYFEDEVIASELEVEQIYVYVGGKLTLINDDIDKTDKLLSD